MLILSLKILPSQIERRKHMTVGVMLLHMAGCVMLLIIFESGNRTQICISKNNVAY